VAQADPLGNVTTYGHHFTSEWEEWWLEHRESGVVYLHLRGMQMCEMEHGGCRSGWSPVEQQFDFCEGRVITMEGESILMVLSEPPESHFQPPRGIELYAPSGDPDSAGITFWLGE